MAILLLIISILLIIVCIMQSGKAEGIINALTGQGSELFTHKKERGIDLILTRITAVLAVAFFVVVILMKF